MANDDDVHNDNVRNDNSKDAVRQTKLWINKVVISYGFCPFAKAVFDNNQIHYRLSSSASIPDSLRAVVDECLYLDNHAEIETGFVIFPNAFDSFSAYMSGFDLAEALLHKQGYSGIYQIASFHPKYCFADQSKQDPANYTNRSPLPMFHLLRESSITEALVNISNPEAIPMRNIDIARQNGLAKMKKSLKDCRSEKKPR